MAAGLSRVAGKACQFGESEGDMKKRPSTKALERKLDKALSLMVRTRDHGMPCISCGKHKPLQAGHLVKRQILSTRWHPFNVNGECEGCNGFDRRHLIGYTLNIDKRRGPGTAEQLMRLSRISWKVLPDQLERLIMATDNPDDYENEWFAVQREFAPALQAELEELRQKV